jgi:Predicted phosphoribosyltransferases
MPCPGEGVVLGRVIADQLNAPLDLVITKKIGHPMNPEYAICAVAEEGEPICNPNEISKVDPEWFQRELNRVRQEIHRRRKEYLGDKPRRDPVGKIAIIVDDGIATGFTMIAAIKEMKEQNPKKVVVAIPVVPFDTAQKLRKMADELIALDIDSNYLGAVGAYYEEFNQLDDQEVLDLLREK